MYRQSYLHTGEYHTIRGVYLPYHTFRSPRRCVSLPSHCRPASAMHRLDGSRLGRISIRWTIQRCVRCCQGVAIAQSGCAANKPGNFNVLLDDESEEKYINHSFMAFSIPSWRLHSTRHLYDGLAATHSAHRTPLFKAESFSQVSRVCFDSTFSVQC